MSLNRRVPKYLRGWRRLTWVLVIWFLIAMGVIAYTFLRILQAPSGCADDASVFFCRFAHMSKAFSDFETAILAYMVGTVVLGALWLVTASSHERCPECGATTRTEGGICKKCGHDFFASQTTKEDHDTRH